MARIYKTTIRCHHPDGTLVEPGVHYQTDVGTAGSEPDPADVAAAIWNHLGNFFPQCCDQDTLIDELVVAEEVLKPDIGVSGAIGLDIVGSLSRPGDPLPLACVAVVNRHTGTRSRSARGWTMMPGGVSSEFQVQGKWSTTSAYWTPLQHFCGALVDVLTMGTFNPTHLRPVVYSRTRHKRNTAPWTFDLTECTVNQQVRWLSSRLTSP